MTGLGSTIERLARARAAAAAPPHPATDRLQALDGFGSNPGALRARTYIPAGLPDMAPLVVVLHGCTQTAAGYDHGSGWSQLADARGFALLFPEQQRANNPNLCFNWFSPADARRDAGEAHSIRQMIAAMIAAHSIDPHRIYVTGLSAGGAMASIMLASYPEVFAGGAVIAGLPYGAANAMGDAFARMRGQGYPSDARLGALVEGASAHEGPWPTLSVWQGSADTTVDPSNAQRILGQWRAVHGVGDAPSQEDVVDGHVHQIWRDATGRAVIEYYDIGGMAHGTPLQAQGTGGVGTAGPHMLEAGISSTRHIARFWGLDEAGSADIPRPAGTANARHSPAAAPAARAMPADVGTIIADSLRAAGLLR
ncbi:extracellular catalytic domain type 1 short-chain-length polyhydroxyalkanoate depolymerase [Polymorphobacter fuscus]|uniref:extracellular catalytic domain type 1 short-chain-length polyhydroxyalkanoate depolymerase n=1 Tax=Sandarakinorhabdus fusca TaxID=1439888 RepID=UPI0016A75FEA|nr:PHB depolymerase family esterase [Polymorphobacter fuscus]NJC07455.1 poly(hydroxyalkanoate) depolymerase family esterase [Polymorphobacter fuscus]